MSCLRQCSILFYLNEQEEEEVEEIEEMEVEPSLDNLSHRIKYLEEFNHFLKSDVIDISSLREFKRYQQRKLERQVQNHNG